MLVRAVQVLATQAADPGRDEDQALEAREGSLLLSRRPAARHERDAASNQEKRRDEEGPKAPPRHDGLDSIVRTGTARAVQ